MNKRRKGGFLMSKIHQLSGRIFNRKLKEAGIEELNSAQGRILFVLWEKDGIPISELSRKTQLKKSTLTSMLDRLEKKDLICRVFSPEDRRIILIKRGPKDIGLEEIYNGVSRSMTALFYKGIAEEKIDEFESLLEKILENLENYQDGEC